MAKRRNTRFEDAPLLTSQDFLAFEKHKWRDPDCNPERLLLKRKLQSIGEPFQAFLKKAGEDLTLRTSIHNPYTFNGNKVDALWFYLSPSDKAKKSLRDLLGVEFASDTDASYVHANLLFHINFDQLTLGLRVHHRAWWDTQNLRNRCSEQEGAEQFAALLNDVPGGYVLTLHDWKQEYRCGQLKWDDVLGFFRYFEPGSHRIQVQRIVQKDDPILEDPEFYRSVAEEFSHLLPIYRFILWSPDNNFLRMKR